MDVKADLGLLFANAHFIGFVMLLLNCTCFGAHRKRLKVEQVMLLLTKNIVCECGMKIMIKNNLL